MHPLADESWDPTHTSGPQAHHWTCTNVGEAAPGVLTPLATAHWYLRADRSAMRAMHAIGVLSRAERFSDSDPAEKSIRLFYGRIAVRLEFMTVVGDRMPGVTGEEILVSLLGAAPNTVEYHPTARRYPSIAVRAAYEFATCRGRLWNMCEKTDAWWRHQVRAIPHLGAAELTHAVNAGARCFEHAISLHMIALFGSVQPTFDALDRLLGQTGVGDSAVLSGSGGAEMGIVGDIWRASRGTMAIEDIVANHGFHGPDEGEVSSVVWREDDTPLRSVVEHYGDLPDDRSPQALEAAKEARRASMEREVLAAVHPLRRANARIVMKLARERVPDRGRGKRAFLQSIDVTRMAARRLGELWANDGILEQPEDIFYLTEFEITGTLPAGIKELVAQRRERRQIYQALEFKDAYWFGAPELVEAGAAAESGRLPIGAVLEGTGASSGIVEGPVRVVDDPSFDDVEPGEVLVARTTDPSWCSIMFVSSALVVDLGGALSHAAVVARELEIPCVVSTGDGTRRLRTGDRVRVDGDAGTVTVIATPVG